MVRVVVGVGCMVSGFCQFYMWYVCCWFVCCVSAVGVGWFAVGWYVGFAFGCGLLLLLCWFCDVCVCC